MLKGSSGDFPVYPGHSPIPSFIERYDQATLSC